MQKSIHLQQVETNNLNIPELYIPHDKLVVVSGPSGSGKTSLIYQTLAKYADNLFNNGVAIDIFSAGKDSYKFEKITGMTPTKILDQKANRIYKRQTLSQYIGLHNSINLLFSNFANQYCEKHNILLKGLSSAEISSDIMPQLELPEDLKSIRSNRFELLVPLKSPNKKLVDLKSFFFEIQSQIQIDEFRIELIKGKSSKWVKFEAIEEYEIDELIEQYGKLKVASIYLIYYTIGIKYQAEEINTQIIEVRKIASKLQQKQIALWSPVSQTVTNYKFASGCLVEGCLSNVELENLSIFNHLFSKHRCITCTATGWIDNETCTNCHGSLLDPVVHQLTIFGFTYLEISKFSAHEFQLWIDGLLHQIQKLDISHFSNEKQRYLQERYINFKESNKSYKFKICELSFSQLKLLLANLKTIHDEISILNSLELDYLSLWRQIGTLSGGEIQRAKIVSRLNSGLAGITYILDEPTSGLHPKNTQSLIKILRRLVDLGNNVIVVEHDKQFIKNCDHLILLEKGELIFSGKLEELKNSKKDYCIQLNKYLKHVPQAAESHFGKQAILFSGMHSNNLQNIDLVIKYQAINCIVGLSGSGKSTTVDSIYNSLYQLFRLGKHANKDDEKAILLRNHIKRISNYGHLDDVLFARQERFVDKRTIMRHLDIDKNVAELFSAESHRRSVRGNRSADFQANHFLLHRSKQYACDECRGEGIVQFDAELMLSYTCPTCNGKKFSPAILDVTIKPRESSIGKNLDEVFNMRIDDAYHFFSGFEFRSKGLEDMLEVLKGMLEFNLDGLKLNSQVKSISSGEFQRLWLAKELALHKNVNKKFQKKKYLLIIDEPSRGLHFTNLIDLQNLLDKIKKSGHTILIVEHNIDMVATADYITELGPSSGIKGGQIIFEGTAKELAATSSKLSNTSSFLKVK